jgi:hypothetical protein
MSDDLNERLERLEKAYTDAGVISSGTNWADSAAAGSMRDQLGSPSAEVVLTDAERTFLMDRVIDESGLLAVCRKLTMNRSRVEIPRMSLGTRVMRSSHPGGHVETRPYYADGDPAFNPALPDATNLETGDDEFLVNPAFTTVVLESSKLVLPWAITEEFLEDNPEKGAAEQRIATMMGIQAANDLEDLALNGDEGSTDALLRANDGFVVQAEAGPNVLTWNDPFTTNTFEQLVRELPTKYRRDVRKLRLIVHPDRWMDYVQSIAARQGNMADQYLAGLVGDPTYGGIALLQSFAMPDDKIMLAHPENLVFGVEREMKMRKTDQGQNAIYNDERYYALHLRCDFVIQNNEAVAIATGVDPRTF